MNLLAQILSSQVRAEIFTLLFAGDQPSIHMRELQRRSGLSIGAIQKEIAHMKKLDLVTSRRDGNRLYFQANANHPLYDEIRGLVEKTTGIIETLKTKLKSIDGIDCAFVFGSYAKGDEKSYSDIDLIIVGNIGLRALVSKLKGLTESIQREINPHIYSLKEWREKLRRKDHFIKSILSEHKIFLIGDESVIE